MKLELDAGNSRIKWRVLSLAGERLTGGAVPALGEPAAVVSDFLQAVSHELQALGEQLSDISGIAVASVRGAGFREVLNAQIAQQFMIKPVYATTGRQCAGLLNAYADVERMGVDRWLAMVAAWTACRDACCVVDCGSAMTVDLISAQGRHEGGYIVPGLSMMLEALAARSQALHYGEIQHWEDTAPGTDTGAAMKHGVLSMTLGMLERIHGRYGPMRWYISGGDADAVLKYLGWECEMVPELVLDGLALVLE